jgi:hypothetical protein
VLFPIGQQPGACPVFFGLASIAVTLDFSLPYAVVYNGGGMNFPTPTQIVGTEGYAVIQISREFRLRHHIFIDPGKLHQYHLGLASAYFSGDHQWFLHRL